VLKGFLPLSAVAAMYQRRKAIEHPVVSSHGDATRFFVTFLDNHTTAGADVLVIVDGALNHPGDALDMLYSNKSAPSPPGLVTLLGAGGTLSVQEVDGSTSRGPLLAVRVTLQPMEVQILGRRG
jgi:hypothetical protein